MRREGRLGGRPSNHSRVSGKCRVVNCVQCHESYPLNKSRGKGKGRIKRLVSDIPSTHLLSDWRVSQPSRNVLQKWDPETEEEEEEATDGCDGGKEPEGWALSISLLLETALVHIQKSVDARARKAEEERALTIATQITEGSDDEGDVPDLEAFKNEFEVFKCEIEAGGSPASVAESEDSWTGIEISDADESDLGEWEDDWSLVGDENAV